MRKLISIVVTVVMGACASVQIPTGSDPDRPSATKVYATKPMADPIRGVVENTIEFTRLNNWLNANYESTPESMRRSLKEHLYLVIDSHARQLYEREGVIIAVGDDIILPHCFAWATRMGIFGACSVLAELDPDAAKGLSSPTAIPESFQIEFRGDMLALASSWGDWTAVVPYYFMVGDLREFRATSGLLTQLAIISTGFGRHTADDGFSQATIMVVYSPEGDQKPFRDYWLQMSMMTAADTSGKKVEGMTAYRKFDASTNMHTELVFPETAEGAMAVSYMGVSGTYEHNRRHFKDFLAALTLPSGD